MGEIDWRADLDQLAKELPQQHINLFFNGTETQFRKSIDALKARVANCGIYEVVMELARIVAALGDGHTSVALPKHNRLPFECYWFAQGIYVTAVLPGYEDVLHCRVVKVNGTPIEQVIALLTQIVPHENEHFLMSQLPDYFVCSDILFGLGITNSVDRVTLTLEEGGKAGRDMTVSTINYSEWGEGKPYDNVPDAQLPLYRKHSHLLFWKEFDEKNGLLYFNYNQCKDMQNQAVRDFSADLIKDIEHNAQIRTMVIDLRNNGGGNSELLKPFLDWLSNYDRLNRRGHLYAIVGRDTFSSALLNTYYLKRNTHAIFVGEPTGGKPNSHGEVKYLTLNSSGLYVRYSTKYYVLDDDDALPSFIPDKALNVTFDDYMKNTDPCMEWIFEQIQI